MTEARPDPGPWEDTDVARVVGALQRSGPIRLTELSREPELVDWPALRIQHALVSAWSRNLISIDNRDLLVAL